MTDVVEFEVCATPEAVAYKLSRENIAVYKLKKRGAKAYFGVNKEYVEKVFAIFKHPCYNIGIRRKSKKMRAANFLKRRLGIVVGAALFTVCAALSQGVVFRIKITGSGAYLKPQILAVAKSCGVEEWSACKGADTPLLEARVLALPSVTFCSVKRAGSYLIIDVQAEQDDLRTLSYAPLKAQAGGEIIKICAVCGTPLVSVGQQVKKGEELIGAYTVAQDGTRIPSLAAGFAQVLVSSQISVFFEEETEQNAQSALAATSLYSESVLQKSYTVKKRDGGVTYDVSFSYVQTSSINIE